MNNRETLLKRLQICDFTLMEVALFLDTHPENKEALEYYQKHLALRENTLQEYVKRFGPITQNDQKNSTTWEWVKGPWPWENSEV